MVAITIDNIQYIHLTKHSALRHNSLEDYVYATLLELFHNGNYDICITANYYNAILTNNITLEKRNIHFKYANILYDSNSDYTLTLYNWLVTISLNKNTLFDFVIMPPNQIDIDQYIPYHQWCEQILMQLIHRLKKLLKLQQGFAIKTL